MEIGAPAELCDFGIEALRAWNVSVFANVACYPNLKKIPMLAKHAAAKMTTPRSPRTGQLWAL